MLCAIKGEERSWQHTHALENDGINTHNVYKHNLGQTNQGCHSVNYRICK